MLMKCSSAACNKEILMWSLSYTHNPDDSMRSEAIKDNLSSTECRSCDCHPHCTRHTSSTACCDWRQYPRDECCFHIQMLHFSNYRKTRVLVEVCCVSLETPGPLSALSNVGYKEAGPSRKQSFQRWLIVGGMMAGCACYVHRADSPPAPSESRWLLGAGMSVGGGRPEGGGVKSEGVPELTRQVSSMCFWRQTEGVVGCILNYNKQTPLWCTLNLSKSSISCKDD